jgi:hypothetical protein
LLSSWGVGFEGFDVEAEPERRRDLEPFGVPRVPATIVGDRAVHGWNPRALAELVGVPYQERERLSAEALAARLDLVLAATQRAMRQVPREHLGMKAPGRDRTVRQLGFHIFRLSAAFVDTREQGHLPESTFEENPPPEMADGEAIAVYGETVRRRLAEYRTRQGWCDGGVSTYYGPQSAHDFMERTTWHAAQHLRQLYWFLAEMGVRADGPLTDADFEGLPIPRDVWS